mgnify:CR=1 FL=1
MYSVGRTYKLKYTGIEMYDLHKIYGVVVCTCIIHTFTKKRRAVIISTILCIHLSNVGT